MQNRWSNIFFLKQVAIIEINEGILLNMENLDIIRKELVSYYGNAKPFGIIMNRVNPYEVDNAGVFLLKEKTGNLVASATIHHTLESNSKGDFNCTGHLVFNNLFDALNQIHHNVTVCEELYLN
ncbi:hypothetical protein [Hyunsoonleella rubra]|uniref:Uncharacterized protein n=1 Tax=Hyunsoonleella rubra TaxID=1737062 RepID=A0ABW5TB15_9FLAO